MEVSDASSMLGSIFAPPPEPLKKRRKKNQENQESEQVDLPVPDKFGSNASSQIAHLQKVDQEMYLVAKRHQ